MPFPSVLNCNSVCNHMKRLFSPSFNSLRKLIHVSKHFEKEKYKICYCGLSLGHRGLWWQQNLASTTSIKIAFLRVWSGENSPTNWKESYQWLKIWNNWTRKKVRDLGFRKTLNLLPWWLDHSTTQTFTTHAHSHPYKHTYANPTPMSIFEDWVHNAVKSQNIRSHGESNPGPHVLPRLYRPSRNFV